MQNIFVALVHNLGLFRTLRYLLLQIADAYIVQEQCPQLILCNIPLYGHKENREQCRTSMFASILVRAFLEPLGQSSRFQ